MSVIGENLPGGHCLLLDHLQIFFEEHLILGPLSLQEERGIEA